MKLSVEKISRAIPRIAAVSLLALTLVVTLAYFLISYSLMNEDLEAEAEVNARVIGECVRNQPAGWSLDHAHLEEILSEHPTAGGYPDTRRIVDIRGRTLAEHLERLRPPIARRSCEFRDGGAAAGTVVIERSYYPIVRNSLLLFVFVSLVSTGFYFFLLHIPFKAALDSLAALNKSEARFRTVVTAMEDVVFLLNREQRYLGIWGRWLEKNGLTPDAFLGKTSWEIFGEDSHVFFAAFNQRVLAGETITYERWFDLPSGRIYYHTTLTPLRGPGGGIIGIVGLGRDITARKEAEEALREAKEKLEKQNLDLRKLDELKDALIRDVSHELKTPVAKQAMQMEILKEQLARQGSIKETEEIMRVMDSSIKRQENVIRNILTLSLLQSGERHYRHEPIRPDQILRDIVEDYRSILDTHGILVSLDIEEVAALSDSEMLWHVFTNLVNNAVKYRTHAGAPRIDIRLRRVKGDFTIEIADNGIGLSEEEQARVFSPFYQATPSAEGIGVGLTIVRMIVEGLGGRVRLESPGKGKGCSAVVTLPLDAGTAAGGVPAAS